MFFPFDTVFKKSWIILTFTYTKYLPINVIKFDQLLKPIKINNIIQLHLYVNDLKPDKQRQEK